MDYGEPQIQGLLSLKEEERTHREANCVTVRLKCVTQLQAKEHQKLLVNPQILGIYKEVSLHMSEGA